LLKLSSFSSANISAFLSLFLPGSLCEARTVWRFVCLVHLVRVDLVLLVLSGARAPRKKKAAGSFRRPLERSSALGVDQCGDFRSRQERSLEVSVVALAWANIGFALPLAAPMDHG